MNTNDVRWLSLYLVYASLIAYLADIAYISGNFSNILFKNYLSIFAAIAEFSASAWITLAIIDRALKEDKKKTWKIVKEHTYDEIIDYVSYITTSILLTIPYYAFTREEIDKRNKTIETIHTKTHNYNQNGKIIAESIADFVNLFSNYETYNHMIEAFNNNPKLDETHLNLIKLTYNDIKIYLDIFSRSLLPRIINFSENDEVRSVLIDLERTSIKYEKDMLNLDNQLWAKAGLGIKILDSQIDLLKSAANVYWFISNDIENHNIEVVNEPMNYNWLPETPELEETTK